MILSLRPCRVGCRETALTTCWLDMVAGRGIQGQAMAGDGVDRKGDRFLGSLEVKDARPDYMAFRRNG